LLQVQDAVQLVLDTRPKAGGTAGGQPREQVVDGVCEELLGKVGAGGSCVVHSRAVVWASRAGMRL
jgi:hypothetical protein